MNSPIISHLQLPPLSLYIHIPWCVKKCPYCDFNSHQSHNNDIPQQAYIEQLIADFKQDLPYVQHRALSSIFFGGGTPSLFSPQNIEKILSAIHKEIAWQDNIEITLEANPGTLDNTYLADFAQAGINRLSLGVQSFNNQHLQSLGRVHNSTQAEAAIKKAHHANFKQLNIDLMHGLPKQSSQQALADLKHAVNFAPTHISWYQLTIEPNTHFYSSPPSLPCEETLEIINNEGLAVLEGAGFKQYEISAYALEQSQSQHNLNYWLFGDYLGIGAGAHGKITVINSIEKNLNTNHSKKIIRTHKTRAPKHYLEKSAGTLSTTTIVAHEELPLEFFMNALRLNQGFNLNLYEQRTGLAFEHWQDKFVALQQQGFIDIKNRNIKTTALGQKYLNTLLLQLQD